MLHEYIIYKSFNSTVEIYQFDDGKTSSYYRILNNHCQSTSAPVCSGWSGNDTVKICTCTTNEGKDESDDNWTVYLDDRGFLAQLIDVNTNGNQMNILNIKILTPNGSPPDQNQFKIPSNCPKINK